MPHRGLVGRSMNINKDSFRGKFNPNLKNIWLVNKKLKEFIKKRGHGWLNLA